MQMITATALFMHMSSFSRLPPSGPEVHDRISVPHLSSASAIRLVCKRVVFTGF